MYFNSSLPLQPNRIQYSKRMVKEKTPALNNELLLYVSLYYLLIYFINNTSIIVDVLTGRLYTANSCAVILQVTISILRGNPNSKSGEVHFSLCFLTET